LGTATRPFISGKEFAAPLEFAAAGSRAAAELASLAGSSGLAVECGVGLEPADVVLGGVAAAEISIVGGAAGAFSLVLAVADRSCEAVAAGFCAASKGCVFAAELSGTVKAADWDEFGTALYLRDLENCSFALR